MDAVALEARLRDLRVVPVIALDDAADAVPLASALAAGGLPLAEITFRTEAAAEAIAAIREARPDLLVGAGTVLDPSTVDRAIEAGAAFIVAPGFNPAVVDRCLDLGVPVIPGVATPTEIEAALGRGLRLLKLFPAEALGGVRYLSAIAAPYLGARFVPTGGISAETLASWLAIPSVVACGGTWLAAPDRVRAGGWARITELAAEAMGIVAASRA